MADTTSTPPPEKPDTTSIPITQTINQSTISVDDLNNLERYKNLQSSINNILKDTDVTVGKAIEKVKEYSLEIAAQQKKINELSISNDVLSTKYDLVRKNLETDIKASKDYSDILENNLNNSLRENIDFQESINRLKEENNKITTELGDKLNKESEILSANAVAKQKILDLQEDLKDAEYDTEAKKQSINESLQKEIENSKQLEDTLKKINIVKSNDKDQERLQNQIARNKELADELPKELALQNLLNLKKNKLLEVNEAGASFVDKLTGATDKSNIFGTSIIALSGGLGNFAKSFSSGFLDAFLKPEAAINRFTNFIGNTIQKAFEFDKILSEVNKTTGGFRDQFEKIAFNKAGPFSVSAIGDISTYGVGIKELGNAYGVLANKINGFNMMSDQQRLMLSKNAATMENLGVSAQNYAELTSKFMASIGKTAEGTRDTINLLARDALAAGRNVGDYAKEFETLMPKIIGYGREATQIFKELNAFAGMTKGVMSTGDLQTFADQFNNWDSAAESVSKLNAALGGTSLNIEDLMRADPTEKLMMLKRTFDESGQDFDKLNIGYKRLLAQSFGDDIAKAAAFFKGNLADANAQMTKMAASEKELEERKKKSVDAQTKLTKAIESMQIALTPVISLFAGIAEVIAKISEMTNGWGTALLFGVPLALRALGAIFSLWGVNIGSMFTSIFARISGGLAATQAGVAAAAAQTTALSATTAAAGTVGTAGAVGATAIGAPVVTGAAGAAGAGGLISKFKNLKGSGKAKLIIGGLLAAGALASMFTGGGKEQGAATPTIAKAPEYGESDDGETLIGPTNNPKYIVSGNDKEGYMAHHKFLANDTTYTEGAVNPNKLSTSTNTIQTSKQDIQVVESLKQYAEKVSSAVNESSRTSREIEMQRTERLITETIPTIASKVKVEADVKLSGELGLSNTAVSQLTERASAATSTVA